MIILAISVFWNFEILQIFNFFFGEIIVGKGYDKEKEEILINVEKTKDNPMDPSDEAVVTEETVVVVPSDNTLGYQIERIDNGYAKIENVVSEVN